MSDQAYGLNNLPLPNLGQKHIGLHISYDGGPIKLMCVGLSLVRILHLPEYPDVKCLLARAVQTQPRGNKCDTTLYVVPLDYVTNLNPISLPKGLEFLPPNKQTLITPDKAPPQSGMTEAQIKARLAEFGVSV